jgi:NAD(P)-dependent dehydrogenase (short-subunit alcohol dehydrogenase family)
MIIITGASKGIGKFLFERFTSNDEKVFGTYNTGEPISGKESSFTKVDVADIESISQWINSIEDEIDNIVLLNCAGGNYNSFAHKADPQKWAQLIKVNLVGTFNVIHAVLPMMREQNYGRIINFSSIVAQMGIPGTSAYAASKSGMWGMSKSIAAENASKGITINNLNLGYFNVGMITDVPPKFQEIIKSKIPTGDFGDPENIFRAVKFLIDTDYINGTSVDINAGLY